MNAMQLKRAYEEPSGEDGTRILVDRLWPRGVSKERARIDWWAKELAPSDALRREFHGNPTAWEEFRRRYFQELEGAGEAVARLRREASRGTVTLVYAARDRERNNAVALRDYLEGRA